MILTLDDHVSEYDLCIVGAGPAGVTVAAELAYSGLRICLLESGTDQACLFSEQLKQVQSPDLAIKPDSRQRAVGGTSGTWGGLSAPMDEMDFEEREWTAAWPVSREELLPYMGKVASYRFPGMQEFEFRPAGGDPEAWEALEPKKFVATVPAYRYASLRYIFERRGVDLITGATVVRLSLRKGGSGNSVAAAVCRTQRGREVRIKAGAFVLAAGGIENPRLLLHSKIGNEHDQVGRYFMNHPKGFAGLVHLGAPLPWKSAYTLDRTQSRTAYAGLRLSPARQRAKGLLNSYVAFFEPVFQSRWRRLWFRIYRRLDQRLPAALARLLRPFAPGLRTLSALWFADMEPRSENRVVLGERRDAFGVPLPVVRYALGPRDRATLAELHAVLASNVERLGGRLEGSVADMIGGVKNDASHHIGGTRMGVDPRASVVDASCRVHSVANLYIAGSSVFPTAGCANPTFTIAALSIRLAEHLKARVA